MLNYEEEEDDTFEIYGENEAVLDDDIAPPSLTYFDIFDNALSDIDFSDVTGKDFKKNLQKVNNKIERKAGPELKRKEVVVKKQTATRKEVAIPAKKVAAPVKRGSLEKDAKRSIIKTSPNLKKSKDVIKKKPLSQIIPVRKGADITGSCAKKINKVIVPSDQKVIVEGVSKFILSRSSQAESIKNIGYYKGKRLNKMVLIFNNDSLIPFNLQLFNPSMPLDYLYSTSLNLNDKIQVAGSNVSYTDVLYNLLANPALFINAKFTFSGINMQAQINETLQVINKEVTGTEKIIPLNISLQIDNMQVQNDVVVFDIMKTLNRPYIPDGMDVVNYTILPGNTVTMAFYYKQVSLKKVFYQEARDNKTLL
jgi:hypothetical protein